VKDEYFGDINDYRKYGLLRVLGEVAKVEIAVCWMLTPDEGRETDVKYLNGPKRWRSFDPELFDFLREMVIERKVRNVRVLEGTNILPRSRFFSEMLQDDLTSRARYFERVREFARGAQLVFFDPDNGMDVKSVRIGQRGPSKFLYRNEVSTFFAAGHSLLIYQVFPREKRDPFIRRLTHDLGKTTGTSVVFSYSTDRMVFSRSARRRGRPIHKSKHGSPEPVGLGNQG